MTARLEYLREPGGERCLDASGLERSVERRWGRRVFTDDTRADIVLIARIGPHGTRAWSASLEMRRADGSSLGSRELTTTAADCSALDDAVALATGLMLDVSVRRVVEERERAAQATTPVAEKRDVLGGPRVTIPEETPAPRQPWRVEPAVAAEGALGLVPGMALGLRAGVAVEPPRFFRVELAAGEFFPTETRAGAPGGRFAASLVDLAVCPLLLDGRSFKGHACIEQRVGSVRAEGLDLDAKRSADEAVFTAGVGVGGSFRLAGPLALDAGVGADATVLRYRFVYRDANGETGVVYRMAPALLTARLGLALEL